MSTNLKASDLDPAAASGVQPPPAELLLSAIIDSSDDAIISKDLDGSVTSWNNGAERIFGYAAKDMIGHSVALLLPDDRKQEETEILARVQRGERVDHYETTRHRKDGQVLHLSVTLSPIRVSHGDVIGMSMVARDITEQKRTHRADLLLASIVNSSDDAIISKSLESIITSWNTGAQRIFGYTAEEMIGQSVLQLIPPDRRDEEELILQRLRNGERTEHFETIRVRKNGQHFPVSLTISPIRDAAGAITGASKIARDITDLKRIRAELEDLLISERTARTQAEHANRMKDEFLAVVSHELRTPLNAIVGWTQVLRDATGRPNEIAEGLEVIERNALAQAQLINDLLDLSRISSGKLNLDVEHFELGALVAQALETVRPAAELKHLRVDTLLEGYGGEMMGDRRRLQQVLWNLLTNAIKFTPSGGRISITSARVNSHVEISVADTGRGIAPDFLPHIFERFRQADASTTRQYSGLGIGLALVKQLVELHGGEVHAASAGLGQGTTLTISLPMMIARAEAPPERESAGGTSVAAREPDVDLTGVRVLALDDDKDSLEVVRRILSSRHAEVRTAMSVADALDIFPGFRPHVVLSDIGMPRQDGYEFARRLRRLPGGNTVPAAALTALARPQDRMRALEAGFQTHMPKPVAPAELVAVVRSLAALGENRVPTAPSAN